MTNFNLVSLNTKRDRVRKEINRIMNSKDYYTDNSKYERVKALTGLETYLTYSIEKMEQRISDVNDKYVW